MKLNLKYLFLLSFLVVGVNANASRIDRAYKALHEFDYFKAKKLFHKGLKYDEASAAQGLAIIYFRTDNPFHNYDSALVYIERSILGWDMYKKRKKEKYLVYGFTEDSLHSTRRKISTAMYAEMKGEPDIAELSAFISKHSWAEESKEATAIRDSLAFFQVVEANSSEGYKQFADTYSGSTYTELALENYYDTQYQEHTISGTLESYESFTKQYPESPLLEEAERNVFELTTKEHTKQSYINYLNRFDSTSYVDTAWLRVFQLEVSDYSKEMIEQFLISYPQNTISNIIDRELLYLDSVYLPFIDSNQFGFMGLDGKVQTSAQYDYVGFYREGLAVVSQKDRYGFIDKFNNVRVPLIYSAASEFVDGRAIVELNGKIGMIDRNANFVFDCIYDDLSTISEGLSYAELNGKYGYYDMDGNIIIAHNFDDAYDFKEGIAKVELDDKQAFINKQGAFEVPACYEQIDLYNDTLFTFKEDGLFGIMNHECQIFVEPMYNYIGGVNDGLALASIDDKVLYLDKVGQLAIDNKYETYPNFMSKGSFENSVAVVKTDKGYGRIDNSNKELTEPKMENIGIGQEFYPVQKDGNWGLFNNANKETVSPKYSSVQLIDDKYLIATVADTVSVINVKGEEVIPAFFDEIELLDKNIFLVKQKGKLGVYIDTKLVVPVAYDQIGLIDENFLFLSRSGVVEYLFVPNQEIISITKNE